MTLTAAVSRAIDELRVEVSDLHAELVRYGLVVWTAGNISARVPGAEFAVVPGAAHGFFNDSPEEALGILRPWLREQDPR